MTFNQKWNDINWESLEDTVFKIQNQIYTSTRNGNIATTRNLENLLVNMYEAKLLAVRRVTQTNEGKNTPGADRCLALSEQERFSIANNLCIDGQALPIKRVYIPKQVKGEFRPLGIPTIVDRCKQALLKMALEPEAEAKFESNSYGFRPGRSAADAISRIRSHMILGNCSWFVLNADISKCFDRINHEVLLRKLQLHEPFHSQILAWLKAGIFEEGQVFSSLEGTPQGGVISSLLANIALDGYQSFLYNRILTYFGESAAKSCLYIRYADDFVVLSPSNQIIQYSKQLATEFLNSIGLEINEKKTRVVETIEFHIGAFGINKPLKSNSFDFLGFRFIQRYVSRHKEVVLKSGFRTRFMTNVIPSPTRIQRHKASITRLTRGIGSVPEFINTMNARITGWCNYFRHSDSKVNRDIPRRLDLWMNAKARKFIRKATKKRGKVPGFWKSDSKDWILYHKYLDKDGVEREITLTKYNSFKWSISKYPPILPTYSPFAQYSLRNVASGPRRIRR